MKGIVVDKMLQLCHLMDATKKEILAFPSGFFPANIDDVNSEHDERFNRTLLQCCEALVRWLITVYGTLIKYKCKSAAFSLKV